MMRSPFLFHRADGTNETYMLLGWPHARQLAEAMPNIVRVTDGYGEMVWEAM